MEIMHLNSGIGSSTGGSGIMIIHWYCRNR